MSLFNKRPTSLAPEQIAPIVLDALSSYDPEAAKLHEEIGDIALLQGTTFWTVIQSVDNYLVGKLNPKLYRILHLLEQQNSDETDLPDKPSNTELFNLQFFKFTMNIRQMDPRAKEDVLNRVKAQKSGITAEMLPREAIDSFITNYLVHLQRYELEIAVEQGYGHKKNTEPQLAHNMEVFTIYLEHRPEIAALL